VDRRRAGRPEGPPPLRLPAVRSSRPFARRCLADAGCRAADLAHAAPARAARGNPVPYSARLPSRGPLAGSLAPRPRPCDERCVPDPPAASFPLRHPDFRPDSPGILRICGGIWVGCSGAGLWQRRIVRSSEGHFGARVRGPGRMRSSGRDRSSGGRRRSTSSRGISHDLLLGTSRGRH
jgi:hypothetical protein